MENLLLVVINSFPVGGGDDLSETNCEVWINSSIGLFRGFYDADHGVDCELCGSGGCGYAW